MKTRNLSLLCIFVIFYFFLINIHLIGQDVFIPKEATWKYLDDGSDQGTAWQELSFNDNSWKEGVGQFGYGDGDENTVVGFGPDSTEKYLTTYFRHKFNVEDPSKYETLLLKILRDDGAVVYINDNEVIRSNQLYGYPITYRTRAQLEVIGAEESTIYIEYKISADNLVSGENIIAVDVHQKNPQTEDMSFDLMLESHDGHTIRKEPYLIYTEANDEMRINWQMDTVDTCIVQWSTDESYLLGVDTTYEYTDDHLHQFTITGLIPETKYHYRMIVPGDTSYGSFLSSPTEDKNNIKFFAYGDTRTYPGRHHSVAEAMVNYYKSDPEAQTFVVHTGDVVNDGDEEDDWDSEFFSAAFTGIRELYANVPLLIAYGNHEESGELLTKYFPFPFVSERFYWSTTYGPAHLMFIDVYADYDSTSAQYLWLENELTNSTKPWKFIFTHRTGWSGGGHQDLEDVRKYIQPLCEKYNVKIVFSGHNHNYARAEVNGVQHITCGGGGAPITEPDTTKPNIVKAFGKHHFCVTSIDGENLNVQAIDIEGNVFDEINLTLTDIDDESNGEILLKQFYLFNAYPNPFNPSTIISFALPKESFVTLNIYNILGQKVTELVNQQKKAGRHQVSFDASGLSSGLYFYSIKAGDFSSTKKMLLLR